MVTAASPQRTAGLRAATDRRSRCNREPKRPRAESEDNQVNLPINPPPDDRNRSACASVRTARVRRRSGRARSLTGTEGHMRAQGKVTRERPGTVRRCLPAPDRCPETSRPPGPPPELDRLGYAWLKTAAKTARSFIPWSGPACPSLGAWSGASCGARVTHNWPGLSIASSVRGGWADLEIRTDRLRWEACRSGKANGPRNAKALRGPSC